MSVFLVSLAPCVLISVCILTSGSSVLITGFLVSFAA